MEVHLERHAARDAEKVIFISMQKNRSAVDIRRIVYAELAKIRRQNIRYNDYFANLLSTRLSPTAERARIRILRSRMHDARYARPRPPMIEGPSLPLPRQQSAGSTDINIRAAHKPVRVEIMRRKKIRVGFWRTLRRWAFPKRSTWKPWSWIVPSHW
jgi:hypothetical protein